MKKVIAIIALALVGIAIQSCGSSEKCPAYSSIEVEQGQEKS